jgi:diguanylate cyclase (GGDEF)-like protein
MVWFPMCYKDKPRGVLLLGSIKPYDHDEISHIEHLVAQLSIALDNALIHKEIEKLSVTDPLTGVFNRRRFVEAAEDEFRSAMRYKYNLGIVMLDVDDFKSINDTYGHHQGDIVLTELSRLIKEKTRTTDVWARYGGEEFVGLMTHSSVEGMYILAEKLRKSVEEHEFPGLKGRKVTISLGVGCFPSEGVNDLEDLMKVADDNLYKAKRSGKNKVVMMNVEKLRLVAEGA